MARKKQSAHTLSPLAKISIFILFCAVVISPIVIIYSLFKISWIASPQDLRYVSENILVFVLMAIMSLVAVISIKQKKFFIGTGSGGFSVRGTSAEIFGILLLCMTLFLFVLSCVKFGQHTSVISGIHFN